MKTTISIKITTYLFALAMILLGAFQGNLSAQCVTGMVPVNVYLTTDANPAETTYQLRDLTTGQIIFSVPPTFLSPNTTYNFNACATAGHCLKSELIDAGQNGGPSVAIVYDNNLTFASPNPGVFDQFETILVGTAACTDLSPVDDWTNYLITSHGPLSIGNSNVFNGPIAGGLVQGSLCMGVRNHVNGWVTGGEVGVKSSTYISGYNGIKRFGYAPGSVPCGNNPSPIIDDFHINDGGLYNSTDCELGDLLPMPSGPITIPSGVTEVIVPGVYTDIVIESDATCLAMKGGYAAQTLLVDGGRLMPGGNGPICDIFFRVNHVTITDGSTVLGIINCDEVVIGNGNEVEGWIHIMAPGSSSSIGNNNVFNEPTCPPCEEEANNKSQQGDQGFAPIETELDFELYPNPVMEGRFSLAATGLEYPAVLSVYNLSGMKVREVKMNDASDLQVQAGDQLVPGMYICKLDSRDGASKTRKFMVH